MERLSECSHTENELCLVFTGMSRFGVKAKQATIKEAKMMTKLLPKCSKQFVSVQIYQQFK